MKWVDKIYIISLPDNNIRRNDIWNDLLSAGFDKEKIEFIEAVNGNDLDIQEFLDDGTISNIFRDPNGILTKSIYGCALSHQKIYNNFLNTNDSVKTALVLEDDARLTHTGLRTLISESPAYDFLLEDVNNSEWEVIQLGGTEPHIEYDEDDIYTTKVIRRAKYPTKGWAAHSYIINKSGAKKLIENNTPIQFAADTNLYLSDLQLYTTPVSYFLQKIGKYDSWLTTHIERKIRQYVIYEIDNYGLEFQSKTFNGDLIQRDKDIINPMYGMSLSKSIKVEKITLESFDASNGDYIEEWVTIHLKTKTN